MENAFGLNPLVSNLNLSVLPHLVRPGPPARSRWADVPVPQLADFTFIPQATDNLLSNWFGADAWPTFFLINSRLTNGARRTYSWSSPTSPTGPAAPTSSSCASKSKENQPPPAGRGLPGFPPARFF